MRIKTTYRIGAYYWRLQSSDKHVFYTTLIISVLTIWNGLKGTHCTPTGTLIPVILMPKVPITFWPVGDPLSTMLEQQRAVGPGHVHASVGRMGPMVIVGK